MYKLCGKSKICETFTLNIIGVQSAVRYINDSIYFNGIPKYGSAIDEW